MSTPVWSSVATTLGALKPWQNNPRTMSKKQAARLIKSWDDLGQFQTIAIGPDGSVYDGHQRLAALLKVHGPQYQIEARQSDRELSDDERRYIITQANLPVGAWNFDELAGWNSAELQAWGFNQETLATWNSDAANLATMLTADEATDNDAEPQIDRAAELNEKWKVKTGDLWRIGDHRLLCGDSTKREDVERVMQGEKADCIFTDPPYNVASESRNYAADKSKAMQSLKDSEWDNDFDVSSVFHSLEIIMAQDCAVYICTSHWLVQRIWEWMWSWSDFCSYCVWCKPNPMPSLSKRHWTWATELIPYAVRGRHVSNFPSDGHALNWWNLAKSKDTDHPTEKVIEVPMRAIQFSSNTGQIVSDFFAGSGTTIVACQNLQRKCRAIEISPNYCVVILQRMQDAFPQIEIERL
jgi:DNA modification methylase